MQASPFGNVLIISHSVLVLVTFTLKRTFSLKHPTTTLNHLEIPQAIDVKYLAIHLDKRLTWKNMCKWEGKLLKFCWINSILYISLLIENKLLIYTSIIKIIWTYAIHVWGTASKSNIDTLKRFQSKHQADLSLLQSTNLKISRVQEEIHTKILTYKPRREGHPNLAPSILTSTATTFRRLKRRAPHDLLNLLILNLTSSEYNQWIILIYVLFINNAKYYIVCKIDCSSKVYMKTQFGIKTLVWRVNKTN